MTGLNETHDISRQSWVVSANGHRDFPIQNLPFGRFRMGRAVHTGVAIGDEIVDLHALVSMGLLSGEAERAARAGESGDLAPLLALGTAPASALRSRLSDLLAVGGDDALRTRAREVLVAQKDVEMMLPMAVRQFSDMCTSTFHIGRRNGNDQRGEPVCPPMFRTLPVGYDGRATSIVVSGTPVRRPNGIWQPDLASEAVAFGPEPRLDYELELGFWFGGPGNALGEPLSMRASRSSLFGVSLLNDWSARGIQKWEMLLGPFLGKSFATTLSPWIVTMEALAPFRIPAFARPAGDPPVPQHLRLDEDQMHGGLDIILTATLQTPAMRDAGRAGETICRTNFRHVYWTPAQMIAHHASNGCALGAGDLLGSGTCSGPLRSEAACLVEANLEGALEFAGGERRAWIEDGDVVAISGRAERDGFASIGFGATSGLIEPAPPWPV